MQIIQLRDVKNIDRSVSYVLVTKYKAIVVAFACRLNSLGRIPQSLSNKKLLSNVLKSLGYSFMVEFMVTQQLEDG